MHEAFVVHGALSPWCITAYVTEEGKFPILPDGVLAPHSDRDIILGQTIKYIFLNYSFWN